MSAKAIFSRKIIHSWKMINSLVRPHFLEKFDRNRSVKPRNVILSLIIFCKMVTEHIFAHFFYDIILCPSSIHNQSRLSFFAIRATVWCARITEPMIVISISDIASLTATVVSAAIAILVSILIFFFTSAVSLNSFILFFFIVMLFFREFFPGWLLPLLNWSLLVD